MAISVRVLTARLSGVADKARCGSDACIAAVRAALVSYERFEINRDSALADIDSALDGFGVETIQCELTGKTIAQYVNMGDTYACTIVYSYRTGLMYCTSYGDWYEASPEYRDL